MLLVGRRWRAIGVGLAVAARPRRCSRPSSSDRRSGATTCGFLSRYVSTFDELSVRPSVMWNLRGTLTLLIGPDRAAEQAGLINGAGLRRPDPAGCCGVAWLWRGRWSPTTPDFDLRFALTHRDRAADQRPPEPARRPAAGAGGGHRLPGPARAARGRARRAAPGRRDLRRAHRQRDQRQRRRGPADPRPRRGDGPVRARARLAAARPSDARPTLGDRPRPPGRG